jgi:hypothetical protein
VGFYTWLEADERTERLALIVKLKQACMSVYGYPPVQNVVKRWLTTDINELQGELQRIERDRPRQELDRRMGRREDKKARLALQTDDDSYQRLEPGDVFDRIVCGGQGDPGMDKQGMPMFPLSHMNDPALQQYYGVYVGSPDEWLDWMRNDGYCDGDAYVYEITIPPWPHFFTMRDPNSGGWAGEDASREVPEAQIIFSKIETIPAQYITLKEVIPEGEGEDDEDEYEEDDSW